MKEPDSLTDALTDDADSFESVLMTWEEPRVIIRRQTWNQFKKTFLVLITQKRIYIIAAAFFIACWYFFPAGTIDIGDQEIPRWLAFVCFSAMILLQVCFFTFVALLAMTLSRAGDNTIEIKTSGLWYSGMCVPFRSLKTVQLDEVKIGEEKIPVLVLVDFQNDIRERIGISATVDVEKLMDLLAERIQAAHYQKETV